MKYTLLGRSGIRVSELCLGAMRFGCDPATGTDEATSQAIFEAYADAGGNFIDTANVYNNGASEESVGRLVAGDRDHFVVATKYTPGHLGGDIVKSGNSRKNMMRSIEQSLKRLRLDFVDLLYLHFWDFTTPMDEILRAMDDLIAHGKVHYIAVSNTPAWIVGRANLLAELMGWSGFIGAQIPYHLLERTVEREFLPMAAELGIGITSWSPLAQGLLTGRYGDRDERTDRNASITPRQRQVAGLVVRIAAEAGVTPSQVALAWLRLHPAQEVIPVIGADSAAQIVENIGSLDIVLDSAQLHELDAATAVDIGFAYEQLESPVFRNMATAFQPEKLRLPRSAGRRFRI